MMPEQATALQTLQLTRTFQATRERVFRAWTEPTELQRWFRPDPAYTIPIAEVDLRVGGRYRLGMQQADADAHIVVGEFREIRSPERLVFTWRWEGEDADPETLVTIDFHDRGGATEVVLTHERFLTVEARDKHQQGWDGCLAQLAAALG